MNFPDVTTLAVPLFVAMILIEMIAWRMKRGGDYETRDTAASLMMGLGSQIAPLFGGAALLTAALIADYSIFPMRGGSL